MRRAEPRGVQHEPEPLPAESSGFKTASSAKGCVTSPREQHLAGKAYHLGKGVTA